MNCLGFGIRRPKVVVTASDVDGWIFSKFLMLMHLVTYVNILTEKIVSLLGRVKLLRATGSRKVFAISKRVL